MKYHIKSGRLSLKILALADVPALFAYAKDPEIARYTSWSAHQNQEETKKFVQHVLGRHNETSGRLHLVWGIHLKGQTKVIGTISFVQDSGAEAHIDYALSRAHWGNGYITEGVKSVIDWAFGNLPELIRINSGCLSQNLGSVKVLQKVGFKVTERYESRRGGKFEDELLETTLFNLERKDYELLR